MDEQQSFPPVWVIQVTGDPKRIVAWTLTLPGSSISIHPVFLPPTLTPAAYTVQRYEAGRLVESATFRTLVEARYLAATLEALS